VSSWNPFKKFLECCSCGIHPINGLIFYSSDTVAPAMFQAHSFFDDKKQFPGLSLHL